MDPNQLSCFVNSYAVTVKLLGQKLNVRASSEVSVKLFSGEFPISAFPEDIKCFGGCEAVFNLIEDSINQKEAITLNDAGELKFPFSIKVGKFEARKTIVLNLKEVEFDDLQRMNMKIERLEKEVKMLKDEKAKSPAAQKVQFEFDSSTAYFTYFSVNDRQISIVKHNSNKFYPLFSKKKIEKIQRFEFQVTNYGHGNIIIGIALPSGKNQMNIYNKANSICLYGQSAYIQGPTKTISLFDLFLLGSKIAMTVDMINFTIQWSQIEPILYETPKVVIPPAMRTEPLFPFIELYDYSNNPVSIKLL